MSRKFYIQNENGERLDLNGVNGVWLYDVSGLGLEEENTFANLGRGFFTQTRADIPQQTIDGTLLFKGSDRAAVYQNAIKFITSAESLTLVFNPREKEYYRRVQIKYISKGESTRVHIETSISFTVLTPWYLPTPIALQFADPAKINYFAWNVTAWGKAPLAPNTSGKYSAEVEVDGHLPAAVRVAINGEITNPVISLRKSSDNALIGRCTLEGSFNGALVLDTRYGGSSVTVNGIDKLDDLDLSYDPFFRVPVDEVCSIEIEGTAFNGTASAEVYEYYRSV